ncbi:NAD(P)H-binding protein [Streptomyces sp. LX-29]|uniref:NAD(P)-dependent oxidoreductase n=1 Tax=Streptomyces sp. LX-29 TaxID=2900152 RepID=UPI00240D9E42|nr:NAD(P)H-binding protein [Streptomyces sp. LX-29]WFB09466.1 NAD(P)H-binding protein [Streptomyces sp. LX-29]
MGRIVVFGAGGRAGRAAVGEALRRGHEVTAVVREPGRHAEPAADGVRLVAGDVTDPEAVARLAAGHDAAVAAVYDPAAQPGDFFTTTARALDRGLGEAGVRRLVFVGLASILETASGTPLMDTPGYPQEYRPFYLAHEAGRTALAAAGGGLDWLVVSPAGDFDHEGERTGGYVTAPADAASRVSYADFAIALIDEIDTPRHHRTHIGVERAAT